MQQTRRKVMVLHDVHSWTPGWSTNRENNKVTVITDIDGEVFILLYLIPALALRFIRIRLHNGQRTKFWKSMKRVSNHQKIYVKWKNCMNLSLWKI